MACEAYAWATSARAEQADQHQHDWRADPRLTFCLDARSLTVLPR